MEPKIAIKEKEKETDKNLSIAEFHRILEEECLRKVKNISKFLIN